MSGRSQEVSARGPAPRLNRLIELRLAGRPSFGLFSSNLSVRGAAALAASPLDFVIIDLEHSPFDLSRLETFLVGMTDRRQIHEKGNLQPNVVPLVRLPTVGREAPLWIAKQVLDLGPYGIVVPQVESAAEVRAAVQACRFPQRTGAADFRPAGQRGVGYGWAARQWGLTGDEYARRADLWPLDPEGELVLWPMIESRRGVQHCAEIARCTGVAGLFIGPSDLAFSLGVPLGAPAVEQAMEQVLAACRAAGVPCGTLIEEAEIEHRLAQGFTFLALGSDTGLTTAAAGALARTAAKRIKPTAPRLGAAGR